MDKKWIALIVIIIIIIIGLITFPSFTNQQDEVKIGNVTFQIPNGYHIGNSDKDGVTNLTNGTHNIFIRNYDDANVTKYINSYVNRSEENNRSVKISNFTVGKTLVYKSNLNTSSSVHYWFVKKNNTYTIYSGNKNPEMDSITIKLIESIK